MPASTYLANEILDHIYGGADYARPATLYVGLSTSTPNADGTGVTEPSGNNYSRVSVTNNATNFPASSSGAKANGTAINFPTPSGSWGTVTYAVIYDAATMGNMICFAVLTTPQAIGTGNTVSIPIGDIDLTMT